MTSSVFAGDGAVIHLGAAGPVVAAPPATAHPMVAAGQRWDLSLSHASPDKAAWVRPLHALRTAPVIVVLVSQHAEAANYLRDEVRAVTDRARRDGGCTRVIPVALGAWPAHLPFGLGLKQGFVVSAPAHLLTAAERLRRMVQQVVRQDRLTRLLAAPGWRSCGPCCARCRGGPVRAGAGLARGGGGQPGPVGPAGGPISGPRRGGGLRAAVVDMRRARSFGRACRGGATLRGQPSPPTMPADLVYMTRNKTEDKAGDVHLGQAQVSGSATAGTAHIRLPPGAPARA